jgi:hypothetical protein
MKCTLCEKAAPDDMDVVIEEGWMPNFYVGEEEFDIACPECSEKYLHTGYDGEIELKPEFHKTFFQSSSCLPEGFI